MLKIFKDIKNRKIFEQKVENYFSKNNMFLKNLFYLYAIGETFGLSYKDNFKYELFTPNENLKKNIILKSKSNLNYELDEGELTELTELNYITFNNLFNNYFIFHLEDLIMDYNKWYSLNDPFNVDTSFKMAIFRKSISKENISNFWLSRTTPILVYLKDFYSYENIYNIISPLVYFSNQNKETTTFLKILIDIIYFDIDTAYKNNKIYFDKYIYKDINKSDLNNNINYSFQIIINILNKNLSLEESIKEILIYNQDTNINLTTFLLIKFNNDKSILDNFKIDNFLNKDAIITINDFINNLKI